VAGWLVLNSRKRGRKILIIVHFDCFTPIALKFKHGAERAEATDISVLFLVNYATNIVQIRKYEFVN